MAKLARGRLDGIDGMRKFGAAELFTMANDLEDQILDPKNRDDPKWLQRWADKIRRLAEKRGNAFSKKIVGSESPSNVKARVRAGI
jgi:hypothetical protein